jgi:hypothetical protein
MANDRPTDEEIYGELARRLFIAFASCQARLAYGTFERKYARDDEPPGRFWIDVAKQVTANVMQSLDGADEDPSASPGVDKPLN